MCLWLLSSCVKQEILEVEYGSKTDYDVDTFKLGQQPINNHTIIEVVDTQMPYFTKEIDLIENFNEDIDLSQYFEGEDVIDGELEVQLKSISKDKIKVVIVDHNGNTSEREVDILLEESIEALSEDELKKRFGDKIIEKPKPIIKEEDK